MKPRFTDSHKYPNGYTLSSATDIRKTFQRERARLKAEETKPRATVRELKKVKT